MENKGNSPSSSPLLKWFSSLDKFTKISIITLVLIAVATPFIVNNYLDVRQRAAKPESKPQNSPKSLIRQSNNKFIVSFRAGVKDNDKDKLLKSHPFKKSERLIQNLYEITIEDEENIEDLMESLKKRPQVEWVERANEGVVSGFFDVHAQEGGECTVSETDVALSSEEQTFLQILNTYRGENNLGSLRISPTLQKAATWKAKDMATRNYFNHTDSLGRDPFGLMAACGYSYSTYKGENLAAGYWSSANVFAAWKASAAHHPLMIDPRYMVTGIAQIIYSPSNYGSYWANEFGGFNDIGITPTPVLTNTPTPTRNPTSIPTPTPTLPPPPPPDTQAPTVSITRPSSGAILSGQTNIDVSAQDNSLISRVELYVDGVIKATDVVSPYSFFLDTTTMTNGSHTLYAKAFDQAGNQGISATVTVNTNNPIDIVSPVVNIISPASGSRVTKNVTISATATDNVGVTLMEIYIDGVIKATSNIGSIQMSWGTQGRKVRQGSHTIMVRAYDTRGNTGASSITVYK
jgi:uncharacterized protein YkwD